MSSPPPHNPLLNMQLGYALLRDRRVPIRTKLIALGIGAAAIGAIATSFVVLNSGFNITYVRV